MDPRLSDIKQKKKRTHWDRFWGKNISCLFLLFPLASELSVFKETPWTNLNSHDQCSNAFINPWLLLVNNHMTAPSLSISATLRSTTWIEKNIGFILAVSAEHRRNNNTLYYNFYYIRICGNKEYCQNGGQKKPAGKKKTLVGKKLGRKSE